MEKITKILLKDYKKEFDIYAKYIIENSWLEDVSLNAKTGVYTSPIYETQQIMIKTMYGATKKFMKEIELDLDKKPVKDFFKSVASIFNCFIKSIDKYNDANRVTQLHDENYLKFRARLFEAKTTTKSYIYELQLDDKDTTTLSIDLFRGNEKAPLTMRRELCDGNAMVKDKTALLNIDFDSAVICEYNHNKMFIDLPKEKIPEWDLTKHFFEQDEYTIRFWEQELKKCTDGIDLGGYEMSGWLYFHLNHFMLNYGIGSDKGYKPPMFRDNEWYIDENFKKAYEDGRCGLFLYGSRRISKSVTMTSRMLHTALIVKDAKLTVQALSKEPDLKAIFDYAQGHILNSRPALSLPTLTFTMEGIQFGIRGKSTTDIYNKADIVFITLESGATRRSSQKTAGGTPDFFLIDEFGKGDGLSAWKAALPSFSSGETRWRTIPLISGTAGESELSVHAEKVLKNPDGYKILPMQWDILDSVVEPEFRTWSRDTFATFVPGQMSLDGKPKKKTTLGKMLKKKLDNDITIYVTDWEGNKEYYEAERIKARNDMSLLSSITCSYPLKIEDCYVSSEVNKFPAMEAKLRKSFILENGLVGQKVRLDRDANGKIKAKQTNEPLIEVYPYGGGNFDAPIVMLDDPYNAYNEEPPLGLYCMGFDDVKHDQSDGDSVMSATIVKRGFEGGEWANRIVAYYDSRPIRKEIYYKQLYFLMKYYNCRVLYENADNGFIDWVENHFFSDVHKHFSDSVGLATEDNMHVNKNRKFGWTPTPHNIYLLESKLVAYTMKNDFVSEGVEGLSGIDMINHPMLLEELTKYKKGKNADRIRSWGLAWTLSQYYDKLHMYTKARVKMRDEEEIYYREKPKYVTNNGLPFIKKLKRY